MKLSRGPVSRRMSRWARSSLRRSAAGYDIVEWREGRRRRAIPPPAAGECAVLQNTGEYESALGWARSAGLPLHAAPSKNWDSRIALDAIRRRIGPNELIVEAGGERFSVMAHWLRRAGYRNVVVYNLVFAGREERIGGIDHRYGDITRLPHEEGSVGAITCLSVVEHGVPLREFFAESARLLRPGGVLFVSTDFFPEPTETDGLRRFDAPVVVFDSVSLAELRAEAARAGFTETEDLVVGAPDRCVEWDEMSLRYTFVALTFVRRDGPIVEPRMTR